MDKITHRTQQQFDEAYTQQMKQNVTPVRKRTYKKQIPISIQHLLATTIKISPQKRQRSARWTGQWRSKLNYPIQLSVKIQAVNIRIITPLTLLVRMAGR